MVASKNDFYFLIFQKDQKIFKLVVENLQENTKLYT